MDQTNYTWNFEGGKGCENWYNKVRNFDWEGCHSYDQGEQAGLSERQAQANQRQSEKIGRAHV